MYVKLTMKRCVCGGGSDTNLNKVINKKLKKRRENHNEMYMLSELKAVTPARRFGGYFSRWTGASHLLEGVELF